MLPTLRGSNPRPPDHQSDAYPTDYLQISIRKSNSHRLPFWLRQVKTAQCIADRYSLPSQFTVVRDCPRTICWIERSPSPYHYAVLSCSYGDAGRVKWLFHEVSIWMGDHDCLILERPGKLYTYFLFYWTHHWITMVLLRLIENVQTCRPKLQNLLTVIYWNIEKKWPNLLTKLFLFEPQRKETYLLACRLKEGSD